MPKSATITLAQLEAAHACRDQRDLFAATFGDSVTFRSKRKFVAACVSHAQEFRFDWAGVNLLSGPVFAAYNEARRPAFAAYDEALRTALAAYNEATRPTLAAYKEACAVAFANAYWSQHNA